MQEYGLLTFAFTMIDTDELAALREGLEVAADDAERQAEYADVWFHKWLDESVENGNTAEALLDAERELAERKSVFEAVVEGYRYMIESRDEQLTELECDLDRQTAALRDAETRIAELHDRIGSLDDENDDLNSQLMAREADIEALNDEIVGLGEQLDEAHAAAGDEDDTDAVEFWFERWLEAARRTAPPRYSVHDGSIYDAVTGKHAMFGSDSIAQGALDNIEAGYYKASAFMWTV